MNVYFQLTQEFNDGGLRAILSSGQAVVLHRLANTPEPKLDDDAKQTR